MAEAFAWVLHGLGCFILGWATRGLIDARQHVDEVAALQERIAKLKALAKLKAYKESEDV